MLYLAREDEPARHRGAVLHVAASPFAPSPRLLQDLGNGRLDGEAFAGRYLRELRGRWERDPRPFLDVLAAAGDGADCTLVDAWGDEPHAPRRILAAALRQIAATQRSAARRRAGVRRAGGA